VRERVAKGYQTLATDREFMVVKGGGALAT
jgi:hypothetical protein